MENSRKRLKSLGFSALWGLSISFPLLLPLAVQAQRVGNINPSQDSTNVPGDTTISGVFRGREGGGVALNSVRLYLNNQDVTNQSTITKDFFSYRPSQPLAPGPHQVRLEFQNNQGQPKSTQWQFVVQQPQASLVIDAVTHNAANQPLGPGATFLATITGTPRAQATILLIENGRGIRSLPVQEVSPGVYVGTLNLTAQDQIQEGIVVGRLQRNNQRVYAAASQGVVFSPNAGSGDVPSGHPSPPVTNPTALRPVFTNYQNGDRITSRGFRLQGQTRPNAQLTIRVTTSLPVLGGFLDLANSTLVDQTVIADNQGNFQIQVPPPANFSRGLRYLIRATASQGNQTSPPVELTLIQE
ncbi:hypothetical protein [Synechocystis sp. LKSZ1]|uniref:hypothetical protein n=1 Tax=Synechocystis sp. LKSZ1 TaxID=3144951 RepID=UPI00336BE9AC